MGGEGACWRDVVEGDTPALLFPKQSATTFVLKRFGNVSAKLTRSGIKLLSCDIVADSTVRRRIMFSSTVILTPN